MRRTDLMSRDRTALALIDVQARLAGAVWNSERLLQRAAALVDGMNTLGVPIVCTEQIPAKLGPTVPALADRLTGSGPAIAKSAFSCAAAPAFADAIVALRRRTILVAGIEAHVCVYQTAMDLLAKGFDVRVVADAVSSRSPDDRAVALQAMSAAGARITTVEMSLFELLRTADDDAFRTILRIVK